MIDLFDIIFEDKEIKNIYDRIEKYEDSTKGWAYHNWNHVINVTNLVETILLKFDVSKEYIESAKIASLLHDVGAITGKDGHALRSREFAKEYFERKKLKPKYSSLILDSIEHHSNGFDSSELMTLVLIISDKLDITKQRLAKEGYNVIGMRQLQYIEDVVITFSDSKFIVNFLVTDELHFQELFDFYFIKKVIKSIHAFANITNLNPIIQINLQDIKRLLE
ncbi:HD domain-containing protein [Vagococcus fluvialis]|uniref:HD domain-containing protein n=1 Tax=Vagococcus fluvialis TaxID=2738 RepID=UPI003BF0EF91